MTTFFITLLLLVCLLMALLAIPVTLTYPSDASQSTARAFDLIWLFGLLRLPVSFSRLHHWKKKSRENSKKRKQTKPLKSSVFGAWHQWVADPFIVRRVIRFTRDIWLALKRENLRMELRIGLDDPADTGRLWGLMGPIAGALQDLQTQNSKISIEPVFNDAVLDFDLSGSIRFYPLQLLFLMSGLFLSLVLWRSGLGAVVRGKSISGKSRARK